MRYSRGGVLYLCVVELVLGSLLFCVFDVLHVNGDLVLFDVLLVAWICVAMMVDLCLNCFGLRFAIDWYIVCFDVMVWIYLWAWNYCYR